MSTARLVITSVVVEGRSQADTARLYGVSPGWVSKLMARYRAEGDAAFEARSRRPKRSPTRIAPETVELICQLRRDLTEQGLDAGAHTIRWHLATHHDLTVAASTIWRHLNAAGLITPQPKKKPKSAYIRFQADLPNETWQGDFTHWHLATGAGVEVLSFIDDHSRYALSVTALRRVNGPAVVDAFTTAAQAHGIPASVLTDNGMVFTTRFAGGRGGRNGFETTLTRLGVTQKNSRPAHPRTCGKVERFQQTLKRWLHAQPAAPNLAGLQELLDAFVDEYNHRRPHRSLGRATPAAAYQRLPKSRPGQAPGQDHHRVRHDRIDRSGVVTLRHAGRLHHIGIGRAHAGTQVVLLVADLHIRVVATDTGELLRHLTLDPTRDYQPQTPNT